MQEQKQKFKWSEGSIVNGLSAQTAGERITRIINKNKLEALDPEDNRLKAAVLADAKNPKSPLHRWFEWDKDKAHETYLWGRAGELLRRVKTFVIIEGGGSYEVRAFVSTITQGRRDYEPIGKVLNDKEHRQILVQDAFKALEQWKTKYAMLQELADVFMAIDLSIAGTTAGFSTQTVNSGLSLMAQ